MPIQTQVGSATSPRPSKGQGVIIAQLNNNLGGWGKGFVLAVDQVSAAPRAAYQGLAKDHGKTKDSPSNIPLGTVQFVETQTGMFFSNMIAQDRYARDHDDGCAVNYKALRRCLLVTFHRAIRLGYAVHIPAGIGAGLAGGNQADIHKLIAECAAEVETTQWAVHNQAHLHVTLWKFEDTSAASYIPPADSTPIHATEAVADETFTPDPSDDIANW